MSATDSINSTATWFYDAATSADLAKEDVSLRVPSQELGQKDFLKILVTQMTQQDPLSPSGDLGSITEMASFSSLEELRTLVIQSQAAAEQSRALQTEMAVLKANALIGRTVEAWPGVDGDGASIKGTVSAVEMEEGTPKLIVDGVAYGLDQLRTITQP